MRAADVFLYFRIGSLCVLGVCIDALSIGRAGCGCLAADCSVDDSGT